MASPKKDTKSQETVSTSEEKQDLPSVCLVSSEPFLVEPPHGSSIRNRPAKIDLKAFYATHVPDRPPPIARYESNYVGPEARTYEDRLREYELRRQLSSLPEHRLVVKKPKPPPVLPFRTRREYEARSKAKSEPERKVQSDVDGFKPNETEGDSDEIEKNFCEGNDIYSDLHKLSENYILQE